MSGPAEPVPFSAFMEVALYDERSGFYASGGRAGRRGDFLTSPEVGPLFGAVVANALDSWWVDLGQPDPFVVWDVGAGPGTLGRSVAAAEPRCSAALQYVMVERSAAQRSSHPRGDTFASVADVPEGPVAIVLANELLDNIPFELLVFDAGWRESWISAVDDRFTETLRPAAHLPRTLPSPASLGARAPRHDAAVSWVETILRRLNPGGRLVAFDYCSTTASMASRPWREWLRTYRQHTRGEHYLNAVGQQDITTEVALDQFPLPDAVRSQAQWLSLHGIDERVEEGRRIWSERSAIGDLAALKARSRVREAEALADPEGLGAFLVIEWFSQHPD